MSLRAYLSTIIGIGILMSLSHVKKKKKKRYKGKKKTTHLSRKIKLIPRNPLSPSPFCYLFTFYHLSSSRRFVKKKKKYHLVCYSQTESTYVSDFCLCSLSCFIFTTIPFVRLHLSYCVSFV